MHLNLFNWVATATVLFSLILSVSAQSGVFNTNRMDTSVEACDNFYEYVNGGWLKETEIPAASSSWSSRSELIESNRNLLRSILESAAAVDTKAKKGSNLQLIADFYATCMDEAAIEAAGTKPLDPYFTQIDSIKDWHDLQITVARLHQFGVPALFNFYAGADLKNNSLVIANVVQSGLSLPNRDYYTKDDDKSKQTRQQFTAHIARMFELLGETPEKSHALADTLIKLETRLALASKTPVELRDANSRYHKMSLAQAAKLTPNFSWETYLKERSAPKIGELNMADPEFFKELNRMFAEVSLDDWKTYLRWMTLSASAARLPKRFIDEDFNFFRKTLTGAKEQQPRQRLCLAATDSMLGEALGQEFAKRNFSLEAKKRVDEMITNIIAAFRERLLKIDWMSDATRQEAIKKLDSVERKVGYPEKVRGYQGLSLDRKSYLSNYIRAAQFENRYSLQDIGKSVDRSRWRRTPQTVTASYSAVFNEITFPAAFLQPPNFFPDGDDALNYGAIGGVIGHELSHGFDDSGSRFDAQGNLRNWWTEEDRKKFDEKTECLVNQFNGYEVEKDLFINGKLTLGENIGDLAGLVIAYDAFKKSLEGKPRPANIDGFTPEQRFFIGWAQMRASKERPEYLRLLVKNDLHAVSRFRVNGPLSNLPQFAEAFGCKTSTPMVRENRCRIW
jgi:putative endopeptidase